LTAGPPAAGEVACPLLVFGSGQRSGSTLVQRLLSSHPEVLVWGEHGGHLRGVLEASWLIRAWNEGLAEPSRRQFRDRGHEGWIPNLLPEPETAVDAARGYIDALFAAPARELGFRRWGFKEVRLGLPEAEALHGLYPGARVVHVTRDPRPMLVSLEHWERTERTWKREYTPIAMADWTRVNASFEGVERPWLRSWRLEDASADPDAFLADLAGLIEVDVSSLDRSIVERPVYADTAGDRDLKPFERLPRRVRALVRDRELRRVAAAYGYDL
jgi:hypothetical protein